jgi:hypothetical protein
MIITIDRDVTVNMISHDTVIVTRPSVMGKISSHLIKSPYKALDIAAWLYNRMEGRANLVQETFPEMSDGDREFLLSGITPIEWDYMFPKEDA